MWSSTLRRENINNVLNELQAELKLSDILHLEEDRMQSMPLENNVVSIFLVVASWGE
jgi:hypothetical protein